MYLNSDDPSGFEAVRDVRSFSVQNEELWVRVIGEDLTLGERHPPTQREIGRERH